MATTHDVKLFLCLNAASMLWLLMANIGECDAGYEQTCTDADYRSANGQCSQNLVHVIDMLCTSGTYNDMKRDGREVIKEQDILPEQESNKSLEGVNTKRHIGLLLTSPYFSRKPYSVHLAGITDRPVEPPREQDRNDGIFLSKEIASSFLTNDIARPRRKRSYPYRNSHIPSGRQGIVCECCIHNCRIDELGQYCAEKR